MPIDLICLDADDTLWHNMRFFAAAEEAFAALVANRRSRLSALAEMRRFDDMDLGEFLSWALEGDAWKIYDGCDDLSSLEAWRRIAQRHAPMGPAYQLTDTRKLMHPTRATKLDEVMRCMSRHAPAEAAREQHAAEARVA